MYTGPLRALIEELGRLPGIGPKSAQRMAFHLLKVSTDDAYRLTDAIVPVKERTSQFNGRDHVLGGALNPLEGVGPEQLKVRELLARIDEGLIKEVIVCTNPNLEGEATAMYVARLLTPLGVVVSKLASGLPVGGDLEYADELTLGRALEGRRTLDV